MLITSVALVKKALYVAQAADLSDATTEMVCYVPGQGAYKSGCFQVSGTLTSVIVYFEATVNGDDWVALEAYAVGASVTKVTQATGAGIFRFNCEGLVKVRARLDWTTGSVTVYGTLID